MFVKIGDFIKFKGFLVEFLKKTQAILRKAKNPENRQKRGLSEPRLLQYAPSLHTVDPRAHDTTFSWESMPSSACRAHPSSSNSA